MSVLEDGITSAIARHVRLEREARRWSLADLAHRSGVSKAAISKIERGETSPTATVLVKLAGAFDLTLAGLLVRAEHGPEPVSRKATQPIWRDPATGYVRRQVFIQPDHPIEIAQVELPAGCRVSFPASSYTRVRRSILVLAGKLTLVEGGDPIELAAGDCIGSGPPVDITFANETGGTCIYLVILSRT